MRGRPQAVTVRTLWQSEGECVIGCIGVCGLLQAFEHALAGALVSVVLSVAGYALCDRCNLRLSMVLQRPLEFARNKTTN